METFLRKSAIVWEMALGSVLAWELARWTGSTHPFLAPLTAILCIKGTSGSATHFAFQRIGGTIFGVLFTLFAIPYFPSNAWALGLLLLVGGLLLKAFSVSDTVIREAALSILLVLSLGHEAGYSFDRVKDTIIGAAVAMILIQVAPPRPEQVPAVSEQP